MPSDNTPTRNLLSTSEAAAYCEYHVVYFRRLRALGGGPPAANVSSEEARAQGWQPNGRGPCPLFFRRSDLDAWLEARARWEPKPAPADHLTIPEAARYLNIPEQVVRRLCRLGLLDAKPAPTTGRGRGPHVVGVADLDRFRAETRR